ncbi:von Willebrand factor A domain-containing protein 3B-like isoform X2 [Physella acuta]|uniref:von Willebrand factor A domain-containing protein 3B-like isoform X2 n=1 Tax=Physella acuta TaxID=109671 RepID=UPI0027DDD4D0|nr:von Willebrand factor A domain-containing protein 3B-like isoform X2 [Physella acuta]
MDTSVESNIFALDVHMKNASSSNVKFDIKYKNSHTSSSCMKHKKAGCESNVKAITSGVKPQRPKEWELDVRPLISSKKWLQNYGLKKNRLQLNQILPTIGFKMSDEFDESLKKPVSSRYCGGMFQQLLRPDGRTFNVSCSKEKLIQLEKRLTQIVNLLKRRMEWLTTESRRVFGVIEERSITIVLDIQNMHPEEFDQYKVALEKVIREQVSQIAKFNLIRASEEIQQLSPECVPVSYDTIEKAIDWLWNLDRMAAVAKTSSSEAVLKAFADQHTEAVYFFTESTSIESGKEILKDKVMNSQRKVPVHVVSFNCDSSSTITFLKDFTKITGGRFHAYGLLKELDDFEENSKDGPVNQANTILKHKTSGGLPPGAGVREDVILIFEELEEARSNLNQIRSLIEKAPEPKKNNLKEASLDQPNRPTTFKEEQNMTSKEWLAVYGLEARKLALDDILSRVAFKHQDGVINCMVPSESQTNAIIYPKLVNARYCEKFPIVKWKNGEAVHVQVTPEIYRMYEERVNVALDKVQQRIDWLNKGSRSLFGTLVEDQIYLLIDISASMRPSIEFIKNKLFVLMQEQLRHKKKINFVTFNSKANCWKDRLVDVSESSLQSAWAWLQTVTCWGSTNTYAALQIALGDPQTQAIYLLTDGRPDQPPKSILAQVQMKKSIPIHTISFNCNDVEANQFLYSLAAITGGRYHYFSETGTPVDEPPAWQSMDVQELNDEIKRGLEYLKKLADLRNECASLGWRKEAAQLRSSLQSARESHESFHFSTGSLLDLKDNYRPDSPARPSSTPLTTVSSPHRPSSAPTTPRPSSAPPPVFSYSPRRFPTPPKVRPKSAHTRSHEKQTSSSVKLTARQRSSHHTFSKTPVIAGHTRTSILRTLTSSGRFSPGEWLLPETKSLFQIQAERQKEITKQLEKIESKREKNTKKLLESKQKSSKQWLSKHGLIAQRLTILDALASTFVPHKPKYVSIIDKHVMSKVFDEIFPIAHVSRKQEIKLVNPNGVDLVMYEKKLTEAIEKYRKRLNKIVWNALPASARKEFDSDKPFQVEGNCEKLFKLLDEAGWPVTRKDITLLKDEITHAEKFLHQSKELRRAATGEDEENEVVVKEMVITPVRNRSQSPKSNRSSSSRSKSEGSPERSRSADSRKSSIDSLDRSRSITPDFQSTARKVKEKENLKEVMKSVSSKTELHTDISKKIRIKLDTLRGQTVVARLDEDGLYYPAVVVKCPDPRHAVVKYDGEDGKIATVLTRYVIPIGGAVSRPFLSAGDCVLIRVVNLDNAKECYIPGCIEANTARKCGTSKFYSVTMFNGQRSLVKMKNLIKISKERYELARMYIAMQWQEDEDSTEEEFETIYEAPKRQRPDDRKRHQRSPSPVSVSESSRSRTPSPSTTRSNNPSSTIESSRSIPREDPFLKVDSALEKLQELSQNLAEQQKKQEKDSKRLKSMIKKQGKLKVKQKEVIEIRNQETVKEVILKESSRTAEESWYHGSNDEQSMLNLRKSLPPLHPKQDVLARWLDDGWYYRCMVLRCHGDYSYDIQDTTGLIERIWREDIITEEDNSERKSDNNFNMVNKHVIALFPDYRFSYAPGIVKKVHDYKIEVQFYNNKTDFVPINEVYSINYVKYAEDVEYINKKDKELVGMAVLVRNDNNGVYYPGTVKKIKDGYTYEIEWADGTTDTQDGIHIFSVFRRRPKLRVNENILACYNPNTVEFLPGVLKGIDEDSLTVEFCNGEIVESVDQSPWYWLNKDYYEEAKRYYKKHYNAYKNKMKTKAASIQPIVLKTIHL